MSLGNIPDHISPSQINAFIECPAAWAISYLYGYKTQANDRMRQGLRIENLVTEKLVGVPAPDQAENDLEESIAEQCWNAINTITHDRPVQCQVRVMDSVLDDSPPMLGFIDYAIPGLIIDLKITGAAPKSAPRSSHVVQMLCYQMFFKSPNFLETEFALVYGLTRKTAPNVMIWTNSDYLVKQFSDDFDINKIDDDMIDFAHNDIIQNTKLMKYYTEFFEENGVVHLPADRNHYRLSDYDPDIIKGFISNTLTPPYNPDESLQF